MQSNIAAFELHLQPKDVMIELAVLGIFSIEDYYQENIDVKHVPVKKKVEKQKVNILEIGLFIDTSTSVDVH